MGEKRTIIALALLAALRGGWLFAANYPASCFTELGRDRILLMNNDSNSQCPITLQSYNDTNTAEAAYWTHEGDPAPSVAGLDAPNLKDGTHHILWERIDAYSNLGGEVAVSSNKLWELIACRAGSPAPNSPASSSPRTYIPWTTTSFNIDTGAKMASAAGNAKYAGMVSMQNTTNACIVSPYYADGIGAIYFDAVNAWRTSSGELVLEIATETADGTPFTARSRNLVWRTQKVDVMLVGAAVQSRRSITRRDTDATTILLNWNTQSSNRGGNFFRIRSLVNLRQPVRFRIRRATEAADTLDSANYLAIDNVMASFPPIGIELGQGDKELDESRSKKRVLGWESALEKSFAFVGDGDARPQAAYIGMRDSSGARRSVSEFQLSNILFHYRWTYLGIENGPWQTFEMATGSTPGRFVAKDPASGLALTNGVGDIEFYYTAQVDSSPHFWPTDFALSTSTQTTTITNLLEGTSFRAPYGSDWEEGGTAWTTTLRRDPSDGKLVSGGTDWFFRVREGYTPYEDVAVVCHYTNGTEIATSNIWMELVGTNAWRAYVHMPTNMAGKPFTFSFAGYNRQYVSTSGFDLNTNKWGLSQTAIDYLPSPGVADGDKAATVKFDLDSPHLLFEFNTDTKAYAISHAAFQDFNLWTDAAGGYMGYYSTTAAVSEAKQTYQADISNWKTSSGYNSLWSENFDVSGTIDTNSPYWPGVSFSELKTRHGWEARNGMFTCESYTNIEDGLALQMEGRGLGTVSLANLAVGDIPQGIGSIDFEARVAQSHSFDGFAWAYPHLESTNYAFTVKTEMSTMRAKDMSLGDPSVSLVGYYYPMRGCYEARVRRIDQQAIELSLWKWGKSGKKMTATRMTKLGTVNAPAAAVMRPSGGDLSSDHVLVNRSSDYNYSDWHSMAISMFNTPTGTIVQARLARYASKFSFVYDRPTAAGGKYNSQAYLVVTSIDRENAFTSGSYGFGMRDCMGYVGLPQMHAPVTSLTNYPYLGSSLKSEFENGYLVCSEDRYRPMNTYNQYGKSEFPNFNGGDSTVGYEQHPNGWETGMAALVPEQDIIVSTKRADRSDSSWIEQMRSTISNFQFSAYSLAPQIPYDSYVQLGTGGTRDDEESVDIAVDDIEVNSWRGRDYPDLGGNYGQYTNWVYTSCWIENALGMTGSFDVQQVPGTNEYCYIFTNAGKTVTFTPQVDMYMSQALVIGGGGAGGWGGAGGGGGGVYALTNGVWLKAGEPVTITVGEGGDNSYSDADDKGHAVRGGCGGYSRLIVEGEEYTAWGGGGGAAYGSSVGIGNNNSGDVGGTTLATGGGNASRNDSATTTGPTGQPTRMGLGGGGNGGVACLYQSGGGGGAGGNGNNGTTNNLEYLEEHIAAGATHKYFLVDAYGGDGGSGWPSSITGKRIFYGGGGGGGDGRIFVNRASAYWYTDSNYYAYKYNAGGGVTNVLMIRNSRYESDRYSAELGNRGPGKGGAGGGGDGLAANSKVTQGGDGVNGYGGGGGGGSLWGEKNFRPGGKGGNGAVILRIANMPRNQCVVQPTRGTAEKPIGLRSPYLYNGLSSLRFVYRAADTNAVLVLQVATNVTGRSAIYTLTTEYSSDWTDVEEFVFTNANESAGAKACYFSYRAPAQGMMRLIARKDVVAESLAQDDPNYGSVAISSILCYNEPVLDARSWTGWNMWTVGWGLDSSGPQWSVYSLDGHTVTNSFAYLYDGYDGYSCSLNFSATAEDNTTGISGNESDLADPEKTAGENEYAHSYPYVQPPALAGGIGYVQFRARRDCEEQDTPSVVTLFGLSDPSDEIGTEITNFTINAGNYSLYTWRSTADKSGYPAVRLAVKGADGTGGRENPTEPYYIDGTPIQKLQRVWIDDVAVSEPIAPRLALLNARPFRNHLTENVVVTNILLESEQPLTRESFGFQVTLQPQQLADDIDPDSITVTLAYYVGTRKWGWRNWTNDPSVVWSTLKRITTNMVWRSTYDNAASVVSGQKTPGTVVQYYLRATYKDVNGNEHSHDIDEIDWDGGPSWYWPKDYNSEYGSGNPENFSPYTIIDSVSPKRAWINEINYYDGGYNTSDQPGLTNQYIEVAVPSGADMTGWYLQVRNWRKAPCVLCTFGYAGVTNSVTANMVNHYSFLTVASPKTYDAGTLGTEVNGKWDASSELNSKAGISEGQLKQDSNYAFELVRPSGVIEHQVVVEGTNYYAGTAGEQWGSGTNLCGELQREDKEGNTWFFAGSDPGPGTLSVFRSHGEDETCWTNCVGGTPTRINSTAGQEIAPDWYLPPSDEFVWIYVYELGRNLRVFDGESDVSSAVFMVGRNGSTNITFKLDPWYQIASMTTNGTDVAGAAGAHVTYPLHIENIQNTIDIRASAELSSRITDRVSKDDRYYNAIVDWLVNEHSADEGGQNIYPARFVGLHGTVSKELSLKEMYWLDINPTESNWVFRAGMGGKVDPSLPYSQPVTPVEYVNPNTGDVMTNVRMSVFMQLSNETSNACRPPVCLRGMEPGSKSYDAATGEAYTGNPSWTSVTFKVTGALQNGEVDKIYRPLRWFVFGPDSFGAPGTPGEYTATIEVEDPYTTFSPASNYGWGNFPGCPVFYSWNLDQELMMQSPEMLKQDSTY